MRKQYYIWFMNIYRSSKSIKTHGKYQIQNSGHCLGGRGIGGERFTCIHNTLFLHVEVDTWVLTLLFSVFFLKFTTRKRVPRKRVPNLSYYKAFADSERDIRTWWAGGRLYLQVEREALGTNRVSPHTLHP